MSCLEKFISFPYGKFYESFTEKDAEKESLEVIASKGIIPLSLTDPKLPFLMSEQVEDIDRYLLLGKSSTLPIYEFQTLLIITNDFLGWVVYTKNPVPNTTNQFTIFPSREPVIGGNITGTTNLSTLESFLPTVMSYPNQFARGITIMRPEDINLGCIEYYLRAVKLKKESIGDVLLYNKIREFQNLFGNLLITLYYAMGKKSTAQGVNGPNILQMMRIRSGNFKITNSIQWKGKTVDNNLLVGMVCSLMFFIKKYVIPIHQNNNARMPASIARSAPFVDTTFVSNDSYFSIAVENFKTAKFDLTKPIYYMDTIMMSSLIELPHIAISIISIFEYCGKSVIVYKNPIRLSKGFIYQ